MAKLRSMTANDIPMVGRLLDHIFRRNQGVHDQSVLTDFPLVFAASNHENCRIVVVDDRIVSHAAIWPCELVVDEVRLRLGVIVLVATESGYRNRGYVARLMRDLQQTMHEQDYDLGILWTGVPEFYAKMGWTQVRTRGWLTDDLRSKEKFLTKFRQTSAGATIAWYDADRHLDGIIRIHDNEPVRVTRSRTEYAALLGLPKMHVNVLVRNDDVAAYLVAGQAINKQGLIEYGGPARDVVSLAADSILRQRFEGQLPFVIYHVRKDLAQLIERENQATSPLECSKGRGCEMILHFRPDRLPAPLSERLFIWGLDFT